MKGSFASIMAFTLLTVAAASAVPGPAALPPLAAEVGLEALVADPLQAPSVGASLAAVAQQPSGTSVLQGMLAAQGSPDEPLAIAPMPVAEAPADLALPLGRILAAVGSAEALRASAVAALTPEEQALVLAHGLTVPSRAPEAPALPAMGADAQAHVASSSAGAWELSPQAEAIAAKVDAAKLRVAALTLLAAIETSMPELRVAALRPGMGIQSHCASGLIRFESNNCEVVVGDTGPNTYALPATLVIIDLGGADVYANGAALARSSVRVIVDNSGNDLYSVAKANAAGVGQLAEGIASASLGVAVLADFGGDDLYSATATVTAPQPGPAAGAARAAAQGFANIGAAVLLDAGGRDVFRMSTTSSGGAAEANGQGMASIGLGALLNLGNEAGADDLYSSNPTSTLHITSQTPSLTQYTIGPASSEAQGAAGLGGVAIMSDAGGDDTYVVQPVGSVATVVAQGASQAGAALLVDAQGNDVMTARALGDTTLTLIVNNGATNSCWTVTVTVTTGQTLALGQGATSTGAGVLVDGTGNDARLLEARSHAGAIGGVNTTFDCAPFGLVNRVTSTATSGPGTATGQGSGATGVGALIDVAGNDATTILGGSTALAYAVVNHPARVETATATAGRGETLGQGHSSTGIGILADVAGADRYTSAATSLATRTTSAGTSSVVGPVAQSVQGFGNGGLGWLLELDGADVYATSPAGASAAGNNKCWSNGPNGGRGRDLVLTSLALPSSCP